MHLSALVILNVGHRANFVTTRNHFKATYNTIKGFTMDSFRQVFVKQIEVVITKKPSKQVLLELLKITSPQLTIQDVDNEWSRNNAFNILANWMHTGIHPDTSSRALQDLQNVQDFFQNCCRTFLDQKYIEHITNKTPYWSEENHVRSAIVATFTDMNFVEKVRSPRSTNMPLEFHVRDNWPQIDFHRQTWEDEMTPKVLATLISYSCINARGAIAHGQQTELCYSFKNAKMLKACTVKEIFDAHGGTKQLESIAAIKHELINNGPVVSVSFILTKEFIESNIVDASVFEISQEEKHHDILIVGWRLTAYGEVWLTQPMRNKWTVVSGGGDVPIGVAQFGIDGTCLAPMNNFLWESWQSGPYLDLDMTDVEGWIKWSGIEFEMTSQQLEALGGILNIGIHLAVVKRKKFVIRDKSIHAHSRSCHLGDIRWLKDKHVWNVSARFTK